MVTPLPIEKSRVDLGRKRKTWIQCSIRGGGCELDWSWGEWDPVRCLPSVCESSYRIGLSVQQDLEGLDPQGLTPSQVSEVSHGGPWVIVWPFQGIPGDGAVAPRPSLDQASAWLFLPNLSFLRRSSPWPSALAPDFNLFRAAPASSLSVLSLICLYFPIVHELLEITDLFEKPTNAMDTLLGKMHMAIFIHNFANCFGKVTDPLTQAQVLGPLAYVL